MAALSIARDFDRLVFKLGVSQVTSNIRFYTEMPVSTSRFRLCAPLVKTPLVRRPYFPGARGGPFSATSSIFYSVWQVCQNAERRRSPDRPPEIMSKIRHTPSDGPGITSQSDN